MRVLLLPPVFTPIFLRMPRTAHATFAVSDWQEAPYYEADGQPKMTRVHHATTYTGDLEATGTVEYVMVYTATGATFTGLERVEGTLWGQAGAVVLLHTGTWTPAGAHPNPEIVPGTGTGAWAGLTGRLLHQDGKIEGERGLVELVVEGLGE